MSAMYDIIVVGGSYAGISAALQLGRARRRVLVIDGGRRRNRFAASSHGFLGQDGRDPGEIAATARAQLLAYPTVEWVDGEATEAVASGDEFAVSLASGVRYQGRRLVLATGVADELPEIPGVVERWGRSVFHCPYCHGYELNGGRIGVLATSPLSIHQALMLPDWGETTYFTRGLFEPSEEERAELERRDVTVERLPVTAVDGDAHEVIVRIADGRALQYAGLFLASKTRMSSPLAAQLGCALESGPLGDYIRTDATRATSVRGVFACGDVAMPAGSVALAVGDGMRAGTAAHRSLIFP
jgi:thioredoxin reductase